MNFTKTIARGAIALSLAVAASAVGIITAPQTAQAANTTYYVNNQSGSGCSDSGTGTSASTPWCTFTPVASMALGAGDSLLLARGGQWSQQLAVSPRGSATQVATVGAYGTGAAPRILNNAAGVGVVVTNATNAVITGLDIGATTAAGTSALSYGMSLDYSTIGNSNVTLTSLSFHDNRIVGLFIRNTATTTNAQTVLSGITISNVTTTHNGHGITFSNQGAVTGLPATTTPGNSGSNVFTNVLVDRIQQTKDDNNNGDPANVVSQIDAGCPDSLSIAGAKNVVVRNSVLNGSAGCRTGSGTAAIFLGNVNTALVANNVIINTPNTMNPDMVGIDHEASTNNVTVAGNYFADNFGGAIEYLAIHGTNDFSTANVATSNVFIRNGVAHSVPYPGGGAIAQVGGSIATSGTISDNLSFEPAGLLNAQLGGDVTNYSTSNNIAAATAADISHSAAQYRETGSPWGYQRLSGSTWIALPYDSTTDSFRDASATIDRFSVTPSGSSSAGITWTAPKAGVISVRGFALAQTGTAGVSVTRNGTTVTSGTATAAGASLKADDVTVVAGDVLRFTVAAGTNTVSWTPSVAYSSASASSDGLGQWTFSVAGDAEGWTSSAPAVVQRGAAVVTTAAGTTTLDSVNGLHISAGGSSSLRISYQNNTAATSGQVFFTTSATEGFSAAKSVPFSLNANATKGLVQGYQSVVVPMSANALWTGNIERIRISLTSSAGTFLLDSVQFTKPISGWEFDTAAGWTGSADVSCATTGVASTSPTLDVDNSSGTFSQVADINWTNTRMQTFTVGTSRLAQVDLWAYKSGAPAGCLYVRIVKITDSAAHKGQTLFTGAVPPSAVTATGGFVSVYPGLTGLDTSATYGIEVFNPYVIPGAGNYGVGYRETTPAAGATGEYYSIDNNGTWNGPEATRNLKFRTYTAATIAAQNPTAGYGPLPVSGGVVSASTGYQPAMLSPGSLGIAASGTRYIHIRMSNPDNNVVGYLLFTTTAHPDFDQAGDGLTPDEPGGKGITFALVPGADFHEYILDMSTVTGWTGTIQQLMVEPANRWSYRVGNLASTWSGKIDYIRLDSGVTTAAAG